MFRVSVRSWQWSGTSAQQSVGDHVKSAASSRRSNQSERLRADRVVLWIPTNPNGVMNRWVDSHYAMDLM